MNKIDYTLLFIILRSKIKFDLCQYMHILFKLKLFYSKFFILLLYYCITFLKKVLKGTQ